MGREWAPTDIEFNERPGAWLSEATNRTHRVHDLLPATFAAYARIFHPAGRTWNPDSRQYVESVSWRNVASANGRIAHPAMEWGSIVGPYEKLPNNDLWDKEPNTGQLPYRETQALAGTLAMHTSTPDQCWFAFWEGRNFSDLPSHAPRLNACGCGPMVVMGGPITRATDTFEDYGPNLWWPHDRAWCVATNIDLMTTYIGGSTKCINHLLENPAIESVVVQPDQDVTWRADIINPLPAVAFEHRRQRWLP